MTKPTIEQVAWVLENVADHLRYGGSYRSLLYVRLEMGPEAYAPLMDSGMFISNFGSEAKSNAK